MSNYQIFPSKNIRTRTNSGKNSNFYSRWYQIIGLNVTNFSPVFDSFYCLLRYKYPKNEKFNRKNIQVRIKPVKDNFTINGIKT